MLPTAYESREDHRRLVALRKGVSYCAAGVEDRVHDGDPSVVEG